MTTAWMPAEAGGRLMRAPLAIAGVMIDAYAEGARVYWSFWGPIGEPVIAAVELIAEIQRRYLAILAESFERFSPAT